MVAGIEKFREYFAAHEDQYAIIGGAACDLLFNAAGLDFRATKDIDMVLCVEVGRQPPQRHEPQGGEHGQRTDRAGPPGTLRPGADREVPATVSGIAELVRPRPARAGNPRVQYVGVSKHNL